MKLLIHCLGLLLFVFGVELGSSDAFFLPFLENKFEAPDQSVNRWKCHDEPNLCTSCFVLLGKHFCIKLGTLKPQGFVAAAFYDNKPFLMDTITAPGTTVAAVGHEACWFVMKFDHVDPKKRSGVAGVLFECKQKRQAISLGTFEINVKNEENGMTFGAGLKNVEDLFLWK